MVLKTNGLAEILRQVLTQASEIQVAFVFGSIARNEEKADSDVDLLIIGDTGLREATKLLSGVSERIGREINPYVMKIEEFLKRKKAHEHFVTRVLAESKLYVIGNDNDLAAMG
jgi:predicted nucleotidyltransferase